MLVFMMGGPEEVKRMKGFGYDMKGARCGSFK
jgi:hypothetical protein